MAEPINVPERLWKYRPWDKHTEHMLTHGEIYFATVGQLNDPFEFRWHETVPTDADEIDVYVRELCAKQYPRDNMQQRRARYRRLLTEVHAYANVTKGQAFPTIAEVIMGVFCASEIKDDILMWSHYAGNHTGICAGVRPASLKGTRFVPVQYAERVPKISVWEYVRGHRDTFLKLSRTKAQHWSYEKEWRSIKKPGVHSWPGCVDQVIIGALASETTRAEVREAALAAIPPIPVYQAHLSTTHYRLDVRDANALNPPHTARSKSGKRNRRLR